MAKKKHTLTFQEFLENKKNELNNPATKRMDWDLKKEEWIKAVNTLYDKVDKIIVVNFKKAGYEVETQKEEVRIIEDFIGSYYVPNYILKAGNIKIHFNPIGAVMVGSNGRVDMILPNGTIKLILTENNEWKIVIGLSVSMELVDFNEKNIQKIFEDNL